LAVLVLGAARAQTPGYLFKSLITLDAEVPGGDTITSHYEVGNLNVKGQATVTTNFSSAGGQGMLFFDTDGKVTVVSRAGMDAPGGGTFTGGGISHKMPLNDAGNLAYTADVNFGDSSGGAVFFYDRAADKATVVMRPGAPIPGGGTSAGNDSFVAMNNANDIVIPVKVTESSAGPSGTALVLYSGGQLSTLVRPGGTGAAGNLIQSYRPHLTDNGIVTFEGKVDGDSTFGAYMIRNGELTVLATPDTQAPGGTAKFANLRGPQANSNGDVIMLGNLEDGNWGVYLWRAAEKKLVAVVKPGDDLPGIGKVASADGGGRNSVRLGDDGSILFVAALADGSEGLFRIKDGTTTPVVKTSQEMKGVGTASILVSSSFPTASYGLGYNVNGQILFPAGTSDGKEHLVLATP
jgi:hypothetical protein